MFGAKVLAFYRELQWVNQLPGGIKVMNPYRQPETIGYVEQFLNRFFSDAGTRVFVFGINPGRFGAGLTGVTFTDPVALERSCGIPNALPKRRELSSEFVYEFIERWGGVERFYRQFFLTAVSPLGFTVGGKNYNYYDDENLFRAAEPFIIDSMRKQLACGASRRVAIVFGKGKNQTAFAKLNAMHGLFDSVFALDHPRYIMQYRRRKLDVYLNEYKSAFEQALRRNSLTSTFAYQEAS